MRRLPIIMIIIGVGLAMVAQAYSLSGSAASGPNEPAGAVPQMPDFNSLLGPFTNFIHSVNSINAGGGTPVPLVAPQPIPTNLIHDPLQAMDGWLFGILGFHISGIVSMVLGGFSWLFGVLKQTTDSIKS